MALFLIFLVSFAAAYLNYRLELVALAFPWTWLSLFLVLSLLYAVCRFGLYPLVFDPLKHVPMVKGTHPLLGHAMTMLHNPLGIPHCKWMSEAKEGTDFVRTRFLRSERLIAVSPQAANAVLHLGVGDAGPTDLFIRAMEQVIGRTIFTATGQHHKELRRAFMPAFSPESLRKLGPIITQSCLQHRDNIVEAHFDGAYQSLAQTIDFWPVVHNAAMRSLLEAALSINLDSDPLGKELLESYHFILPLKQDTSFVRLGLPILIAATMPPTIARAMNAQIRQIHETSLTISRVYRCLAEKRLAEEAQLNEKDDLLGRLQKREFNRDADHIVSQLNVLMAAGHETTAVAMIWSLFELARDPAQQAVIRAELRAAAASEGAAHPSAAAVAALPALHAFVLEVFRLYPPAPVINKEARRDLVVCGQVVPRGTTMQVSAYAHHRQPAVWGTDAAVFRPARWLDGSSGEKEEGPLRARNLHTFAQGARACPGRELATFVLKVFLGAMLPTFEFECPSGAQPEMSNGIASIRPKDGVPLLVRLVQH